MDAMPSDFLLQVEGMTCDGCTQAVQRIIRRLDPEARVAVDLDHGCVAVTSREQGPTLAEALTQAGYPAHATGG